MWNDQRTAAECAEIEHRAGGRRKLIKMVANPALTGFTAPKILWLRNHEPREFRQAAQGAAAEGRHSPPPDRRIRHRSERRQRHAAAWTWPSAAGRRRCSSKLELDVDLLPRCYESEASHRASSRREAAEELGLSTDCLVVGGAGDCAAGAVGNGIVAKGIVSTSIGTSGVMFVHSDTVEIDPDGRLHTFCHAVHGKWHVMGVTLSAGGSLQWFRNELCHENGAADDSRRRPMPTKFSTARRKVSPPGSDGLFFLPYLSGERTPHADPDARGCFIGLTLAHRRGHMVRSIMEGVTYSLRDSLAIIRELGVPVREIRASGGGSKSALWRQIQADVFGQKVVDDQRRGRPGLRRGPAGGRRRRRVQEYPRSLRRDDPRRRHHGTATRRR